MPDYIYWNTLKISSPKSNKIDSYVPPRHDFLLLDAFHRPADTPQTFVFKGGVLDIEFALQYNGSSKTSIDLGFELEISCRGKQSTVFGTLSK